MASQTDRPRATLRHEHRRGRLSHSAASVVCDLSGTGLPACLGLFHQAAHYAFLLLCILSAGCSRFESPDAAYQRARSAYMNGDLSRASALASASAARYRSEPSSPWFWRFRLLQAEALTAQNKIKDANALLMDPVPAIPALSQ